MLTIDLASTPSLLGAFDPLLEITKSRPDVLFQFELFFLLRFNGRGSLRPWRESASLRHPHDDSILIATSTQGLCDEPHSVPLDRLIDLDWIVSTDSIQELRFAGYRVSQQRNP